MHSLLILLYCCYGALFQGTKEQYISAGALRLVNGHTFSKGQVEVWLNGQWNFICDDYWGRKEAAVVCKEIGYTAGALSAHKGAKFGHGRGTLLLDDVECGRHDSSLLSCSHVGLYPRSCNKYKAAGVTCSGMCTYITLISVTICIMHSTVYIIMYHAAIYIQENLLMKRSAWLDP